MKTKKQVNKYRSELSSRWMKIYHQREMTEIDTTSKMSLTAEMAHLSSQMILLDWVAVSDNSNEQ